MSVSDWSTEADSNSSIPIGTTGQSINVAEGCPPSGVNNAIRQMMADLRTEHDSVSETLTSHTSSISTLTTAISAGKVPIGTICMWSGTTSDIPSGWALCNGSNGTRDLRDRFIVGAGSSYSVGATGGSASITPSGSVGVSVGGHVLSYNEMPVHNHRVSYSGAHGGSWYNGSGWLTTIASRDWSSHNIYCDGAGGGGSHDHGGSGWFSGNAFDNRPPYYALCFIQRVS